jgi:hypothetical protein
LTANQVAKPNEQQRQRRQKQHRLNLVHPPSPAPLVSAVKILTHRDFAGYISMAVIKASSQVTIQAIRRCPNRWHDAAKSGG